MKKTIKITTIIFFLLFILVLIINIVELNKCKNLIYTDTSYDEFEYVLVLGASVKNNYPSLMLKDRLDKAIEIYNSNNNIKIILSGDSVKKDYDEVGVMLQYLLDNEVEKDNIILDKYGISTYDSLKRIENIVQDKKLIIVTQKYHLTRSLYIALSNDFDAVGVSAYDYRYNGQLIRDIREVLARVKDYFLTKINSKPKYEL